MSEVKNLLANDFNKFAVNARQCIFDIKQIASQTKNVADGQETIADNLEKIINLSNQTLKLLKDFEEKATGEVLLPSPQSTPENL